MLDAVPLEGVATEQHSDVPCTEARHHHRPMTLHRDRVGYLIGALVAEVNRLPRVFVLYLEAADLSALELDETIGARAHPIELGRYVGLCPNDRRLE